MVRSRWLRLIVPSLVLLLTFTTGCQTWTEGTTPSYQATPGTTAVPAAPTAVYLPHNERTAPAPVNVPFRQSESTCEIYTLSHLGDDPSLARWVANTIPEVIQPGSWSKVGSGEAQGKRFLTFNERGRVMVVYHSPAVQAQVAAFLKKIEASLPQEMQRTAGRMPEATETAAMVVPAKFMTGRATHEVELTACSGTGYPVPAPVKAPRHLFHFVIRYEGDGIIDQNVVRAMKSWDQKSANSNAPSPQACPVPPDSGPVPPTQLPSTIPPPPPKSGGVLQQATPLPTVTPSRAATKATPSTEPVPQPDSQ